MLPVLCVILASADEYWDQRVSHFALLPVHENDIVFIGNSITDGGELNELFENERVLNRGIRSDDIPGVIRRLKEVTDGHPKKIFLLIGVNDISHGLSVDTLAARYAKLVNMIRSQTPDTKLYLQSVMPVNNSFKRYKSMRGKEPVIKAFNKKIKEIAESSGSVYVDLWPFLSDDKGNLRREFTNDGLHLTGKGYRAWAKGIRHLVDE